MSTLSAERCVACRRDSPRVTEVEIAELRREVSAWQLVERDGIPRLERLFHCASFADALALTNRIGALAASVTPLATWAAKVPVSEWTTLMRVTRGSCRFTRSGRARR